MKKLATRILIITALLFGVILAFLLEEHFRGKIVLNSRLKQLAAQGENLGYKELLPSKVSVEQNAALDLSLLTNDFHAFSWSSNLPYAFKFTAPGRAIISWQQEFISSGSQTNSWNEFTPKIRESLPVLNRLQNIWTKQEFDDGFDYSKGFLDMDVHPLLAYQKKASLLLSVAAFLDLRESDREACVAHLHSMLSVVRCQQNQPLIISQLVRIACARIAFITTWEALNATGWTDSQLSELQNCWQDNEFAGVMLDAVKMERGMTLETFRQVHQSREKTIRMIDKCDAMTDLLTGTLYKEREPISYWFHRLTWRFAWSAQDELRAINEWEFVVEGLRLAVTNSWNATSNSFDGFRPLSDGSVPARNQKVPWYDDWISLSKGRSLTASLGLNCLRSLEVETDKNIVVTAIALKRYELRHGKPAAELTALVPEFLAALPIDRMDGKPLRYHLNPDGSFKLYSVGLNGTDEGGDPTPEKPLEHFRNIWQGKDAVWPMPAVTKSE